MGRRIGRRGSDKKVLKAKKLRQKREKVRGVEG
jgi:hypothetical protein